MKICPVCEKEYAKGESCPDDGAVLLIKESEEPLIGVTLKGTYRITDKIGAGGMGTVFRATQLPLGREVAVKVLTQRAQGASDAVKRFYREAQVLSRLSHPNIVSLIDFGNTEDGLMFFVMEHLHGATLADWVPPRAPLALPVILGIVKQMCAGVGAAHVNGLIHRDLKPANVFLAKMSDGSEVVKILDFGIAKRQGEHGTRITQTGTLVGTAGYVSPEQLKGEVEPDPRADIYALGAILYFLLKGTRPYDGPSTQSIIFKQLTQPPTPLDFETLGYPQSLKDVVLKAMAIERDDRYRSVAQFSEGLFAAVASIDGVKAAAEAALAVARTLPPSAGMSVDTLAPAKLLASAAVGSAAAAGGVEAAGGASGSGGAGFLDPAHDSSDSPSGQISISKLSFAPTRFRARGRRRFARALTLLTLVLLGGGAGAGALYLSAYPDAWQELRNRLGLGAGGADGGGGSEALGAGGAVGGAVTAAGEGAGAGGAGNADAGRRGPVRGVSDDEILLGMSAAFSGPNRELGRSVHLGLDIYFRAFNDDGGAAGRKVKLIALDDGYDPEWAEKDVKTLLDEHKVFAIIGNMGTATAERALPVVLAQKTLFFGAYTGADLLEREPPDRYVFNYRPRYRQELTELVRYLVKSRKVPVTDVAVFAQSDAYGRTGARSVARALAALGHARPEAIIEAYYERDARDVSAQVTQILDKGPSVGAVVMIGTYRPTALFIKGMREKGFKGLLASISGVGAAGLADALVDVGPELGDGVIVTQVVPTDPKAPAAVKLEAALAKYKPEETASAATLEGFIVGSILGEGLRRAGRDLDTEKLVDVLEGIRNLDIGVGLPCTFSAQRHQCSEKIWASVLDAKGEYHPLPLK